MIKYQCIDFLYRWKIVALHCMKRKPLTSSKLNINMLIPLTVIKMIATFKAEIDIKFGF